MIERFIYEPDDLVLDYLKYKGKNVSFNLDISKYSRSHRKGTLENIVIAQFSKYNLKYIIDMNEYFQWKRILKLKQLKTKMK